MITSATMTTGPRFRRKSATLWNAEPALHDLLADPMLGLLMARDQVAEAELDSLVASIRGHLIDDRNRPRSVRCPPRAVRSEPAGPPAW